MYPFATSTGLFKRMTSVIRFQLEQTMKTGQVQGTMPIADRSYSRSGKKGVRAAVDADPVFRVAHHVRLLAQLVSRRNVRIHCRTASTPSDEHRTSNAPSPAAFSLHISRALKQSLPFGWCPPLHPVAFGPPRNPGSLPPLTQSKSASKATSYVSTALPNAEASALAFHSA
jgi:hypothetical protein